MLLFYFLDDFYIFLHKSGASIRVISWILCVIRRRLFEEHWKTCYFLRFILRIVEHVGHLSFLSRWAQKINNISFLFTLVMMMLLWLCYLSCICRPFVLFLTVVSRVLMDKVNSWAKPFAVIIISELRRLLLVKFFFLRVKACIL